MDDIKVVSINVCYYDIKQLKLIYDFIYKEQPTIIFVQEANGCLPELLKYMNKWDGYENASYDPTTHIIIKDGYFLKTDDVWPNSSFYTKAMLPFYKDPFILLNIHLCEIEFITQSDKIEQKYRNMYIENMLNHLKSKINFQENKIIIAGDFNTLSHLDANIYSTDEFITNNVYKKRTIWPSLTLYQNGFIDCWKKVNKKSIIDATSWPPTGNSILHDNFLKGQITHDIDTRIDYIYVNNFFKINSAEHIETTVKWFSDHKAVVVTLTSKSAKTYINKTLIPKMIKHTGTQKFSLSVFKYNNKIQWVLSAENINQEKSNFIEIYYKKKRNTTKLSFGWFYVDGLKDVVVNLNETKLYQYSTFDFNKELPKNCEWTAVLYNEVYEKISSTKIEFIK
jgi:exonuclease III